MKNYITNSKIKFILINLCNNHENLRFRVSLKRFKNLLIIFNEINSVALKRKTNNN